MRTKTFAITNKNKVRISTQDNSVNFNTQIVFLDIFVSSRVKPDQTLNCAHLVDINQVSSNIVEFPTDGKNMFIQAYSSDSSIDLNKLIIAGF